MKIIIVGAGFTGVQLAKRLLSEKGNNITIIDNNPEHTTGLEDLLDTTVLIGDGNNIDTLEEAGIKDADALVAVTESDEINIITCSLADAIYPDVTKIARVRNYSYYVNTEKTKQKHSETFAQNSRSLYGIDHMINPDVEAAQAIVTSVEHGVSDVIPLGDGEYELTSIKILPDSKLDGAFLRDIRNLSDKKLIVTFIEKDESSFIPSGDTELKAGYTIGVLAHRNHLNEIRMLCGEQKTAIKKVALVGIGRIGTLVTERLLGTNQEEGDNKNEKKTSLLARLLSKKKNVKKDFQRFVIVDSDKNLCDTASERFSSANVFTADVTDENFINEERLTEMDLCICATHNHELNLMVASYFEALGVKKTVALITNSAFTQIAEKMGVDVAIPIRDTVVDSIVSHLRGKNIKEVHTVSTGELEIIECDIPQNSPCIGKELKEISQPGVYLMMLTQKPGSNRYEIANGNTVLNVGDHVSFIVQSGDKKILELISGKE